MRLRSCFALIPMVALLAGSGEVFSQIRYGAGVQAYPAGIIGNLQIVFPVSARMNLGMLVGYNTTDRRDFGDHDDETGGGPGFGVELEHRFADKVSGVFIGIRVDTWFLDIDWEDERAGCLKLCIIRNGRTFQTGSSSITVVQPAVIMGYKKYFFDSLVAFNFTVSLGAEINVKTSGESVGDGGILLVGLAVTL